MLERDKEVCMKKVDFFNYENGILVLSDSTEEISYLEERQFQKNLYSFIEKINYVFYRHIDELTDKEEIRVAYISNDDKIFVEKTLDLPIDEDFTNSSGITLGQVSFRLGVDDEKAFDMLRKCIGDAKSISKYYHDYLLGVYNGFEKESGFQNKYFVRYRAATEDEIKFLNYAVSRFPNDKYQISCLRRFR